MKKLFFAFAAGLLLLAGCAKEYDDTALKESVASLDKRVTALESQMKALSSVIGADGKLKLIKSQQEIKDNMNVADPEDDGYDLLASWKFNEGSGNTIKDYGASSDYTGNGGYVLNAISKDSDAATLNWVEGTLPF